MTDKEPTLIHRWFEEVWNNFDFMTMFQQLGPAAESNADTRSKDATEDATSDRLDYGL